MSNEFVGFDIRVMREGEAIDTIITLLVTSNGFEKRYQVGRIWYWVVDGHLDEIERNFCKHVHDYEDKLVDLAKDAWYQAEKEEGNVCEYDNLVYRKGPRIKQKIVDEIVAQDAHYER